MTEIRPIALDNSVGTLGYYTRKIQWALESDDRAAFKFAMSELAMVTISYMRWADDLSNPMTETTTTTEAHQNG